MVLSVKKEKPQPLHHRKRQANHHARSKDYDKHYWPYLPLLVVVGLGFGLNILWTPISSVMTQHDVLGYATNTSPVGLLDETNAQRASNGLASLSANSLLSKAAQAKADDMAIRNYWSHTTPDGKEPWWFINNTGYNYVTVGENLAYGFNSSTTTISGWMNSAPHRANLLNGAFQDVGFGIANSSNYQATGEETIVVAMYGKTAPVVATPSPAPTSTPVATAANPSPAKTAAPSSSVASSDPIASTEDTIEPETLGSSNTLAEVTATVNGPPQAITRIETVATTVPTQSVVAVVIVVAAAAALFIYRHTRAFHRKLVHGEEFIVHHPHFDVAFVAVIVLGFVLTRTAGFIN